ncbi:MAG: hypothetical protein KC535_01015 [Nanoarchaeota archaeon]|nr:hypothetical protein [Nanoarchaeota archaeon]
MREQVRQMFKSNPERLKELVRHHFLDKIRSFIDTLPEEIPSDFSSIESLTEKYSYRHSFCTYLSYLPAKSIDETLGRNMLIFIATKNPYGDIFKAFNHEASEYLFGDKNLIEQARLGIWQMRLGDNISDIEKLANLLFDTKEQYPQFFEEQFSSYLKKPSFQKKLPLFDAAIYRLESLYASAWDENYRISEYDKSVIYRVWHDGPLSVGILYKGKPIVVSSAYLKDERTLLINQFQGVNGKILENGKLKKITREDGVEVYATKPNHALGLFSWKDFFVDYFSFLAKQNGLSRIGIQGAINNVWTKPNQHTSDTHLLQGDAKRIYDDYASQRTDFYYFFGNWYKDIKK